MRSASVKALQTIPGSGIYSDVTTAFGTIGKSHFSEKCTAANGHFSEKVRSHNHGH